jgi:hypothetical protein
LCLLAIARPELRLPFAYAYAIAFLNAQYAMGTVQIKVVHPKSDVLLKQTELTVMAAREFQGVILNRWDSPLFHQDHISDAKMGGEWTESFFPDQVPGAGQINPGEQGEWRSESSGVLTGTSGWVLWGVRVFEINDGKVDDHFEFIFVSWSVPWIEDDNLDIKVVAVSFNPLLDAPPNPPPPVLEIVPISLTSDGRDISALAQFGSLVPFVVVPFGFLFGANSSQIYHPRFTFAVRRRPNTQAQSTWMFPTSLPSRQMLAMQPFAIECRLLS